MWINKYDLSIYLRHIFLYLGATGKSFDAGLYYFVEQTIL